MRALNTGVYDLTRFASLSKNEAIKEYNRIIDRTNAQFRQLGKMGLSPISFGIETHGKARVQRISEGKIKQAFGVKNISDIKDDKLSNFLLRRYTELTNFVGKGFTKSTYKELLKEKETIENEIFEGKSLTWEQFYTYKDVTNRTLTMTSETYYEILKYTVDVGYEGTFKGKKYTNVDYSTTGRVNIKPEEYQEFLDAVNQWYYEQYGVKKKGMTKLKDIEYLNIVNRAKEDAKYGETRTVTLDKDTSFTVWSGSTRDALSRKRAGL